MFCNATITVFPRACHSVSTRVLNSACCVWMETYWTGQTSRGAEEKSQIQKCTVAIKTREGYAAKES